MSDVNFEHYKVFYYVAKYRNITSAAHALFLSQPTVSRAVANLETELGCRLFDRSKRGVELTPEGSQLFKHVSVACKHLFSAEEELALMRRDTIGILRLAVSDAAFINSIISRISRFHALYPAVHLKIDNMTTSEMIEAVHNNVADMAFATTPFNTLYELNVTDLCELTDIVVAGKQYLPFKEKQLSLAELNSFTLITLEEGSATRRFFDNLFIRHGLLMKPAIELASISQILPLVRSGLGIGFVPEVLAKDDLEAGRVIKLDIKEEIPARRICLISDADSEINDIMTAFTALLTAAAEDNKQ